MSHSTTSAAGSGAASADRGTLLAFVFMVLFAGGNAVAVRVSNSQLPPFWGAAMRSAGAALVFWVLVALRRVALPKGRALTGAMLYGLLGVGVAYAFLYLGLLRTPASLAAPILALAPLMTFFFAWAHGLEQFRWRGLLGGLIAIAGISFGLSRGLGGSTVHVPSVMAMVVGTACVAEAGVVFKLFPKSHPLATNAVAFAVGTPLLVMASLLVGERWSLPNAVDTWAAFAYLVVMGSVLVFYLYALVLSRWTASATSYSFLLIPVATVVIAAWLLGEVVTMSFVGGALLALVGVWVGAIHASPRTAELTCTPMPGKALC